MAALMAASLTACGGSAKETTAAAAADTTAAAKEESTAAESTAAESKEAAGGKLVMATNAEFPPYEFHDGDKIVGIDAEIAQEQYEQEQLAESEKMADEIQQELDNSQLSGKVDVDFNAEYVKLNLNGSILFASGKADLVKQAVPIVNKLGKILEKYNKNVIEVEGHTDNVPIRYSAKYENNEVLSVYRALAVTDQLRKNKNLNPKYIKFAGRGDYIPVADNSTAEGRAQNRRVEIKIYNSFNSDVKENN